MPEPHSNPGLVPFYNATVYLVLDDFGKLGRAYRETDENRADLQTLLKELLAGEYKRPVRIVAFNTAEGWSRDASKDIAWELVKRATASGDLLTGDLRDFVSSHVGNRARVEA
jgi:hypothetical protein